MSHERDAQAPVESVRINKYLASCGVASRRGADGLISRGEVRLNGRLVTGPGIKVRPGVDRLEVSGREVRPATGPELVLALHKPIEVVTTLRDPQGRRTVLDLLPPAILARRPVPVGRLDYFSEGLLLLTTDGELCHRLTHPSRQVDKEYEVEVRPPARPEQLDAMRRGMTLAEGERLAPMGVEVRRTDGDHQVLRLTLIQGVNREIRRICRDLGLTVLRLRRQRQGPVNLGSLPPGRWRELTPAEIASLRRAAGMKS